MIKTEKISVATEGNTDIVNITGQMEKFLEETEMNEGQINVFVQGSTGAVTVIEFEPNLVKDFVNAMERIAPSDMRYEHFKTWHDDNGYSHIRASVVGCSESIAVSEGMLMLGTWQQVVVVDFDTKPRNRNIILTGIW